jgi:acyl carrier protein
MDRSEILSKITELMRDVFDEDDLVVTDETEAEDVADWDSANHVRLIVAIEEVFKIQFTTDEITAPENTGQLVDLVASKLKG